VRGKLPTNNKFGSLFFFLYLAEKKMICNKCSTYNPPQSKFCYKCGNNLEENNKNFYNNFEYKCNCGNILKPRDRFCDKCNTWYPYTKEQANISSDAIKQKNEIRVIASERQINVSGNSNNNYNKSPIDNNIKQSHIDGSKNYKKTLKNTKSGITKYLIISIAVFLIISSILILFLNKDKIFNKTHNTLLKFYPKKAAPGSLLYIDISDITTKENFNHLNVFINNVEIPIVSVDEKIFIGRVPENASSGEISLFSGGKKKLSSKIEIIKPEKIFIAREKIKSSNKSQTIKFPEDIQVVVPAGFVKNETQIVLNKIINAPEPDILGCYQFFEYDLKIGNYEQLPDFIEISFPLKTELFSKDKAFEDQILAYRRDVNFEDLTVLPYRYDSNAERVYIYTDHLSLAGVIIIGGLVVGGVVSILGPEALDKISYDVYITPQKNFRILYNKGIEKNSNFFEDGSWVSKYSPQVLNTYNSKYPKYVQDVGEMFEIALANYQKAGLTEMVSKKNIFGNKTNYHINIKLNSYASKLSPGPLYLSHTGYIHIDAPLYLIEFRGKKSSCSYVGHELFHRQQAEYYNFTRFKRSKDFWWIEACAEYAGDRIAWKNSVNNWNGEVFTKMFNDIPPEYLSFPIKTTGKPNKNFANEYEYNTAVFVYFLTEVCGFKFNELIAGGAKDEPIESLNSFLKSKTNNTNGINHYYRQFSIWSIFSEGNYGTGYFKNYKPANFEKNSDIKEIAEKKTEIYLPDTKEFEISTEGNDGILIDIFKFSGNKKLKGDDIAKPIETLNPGNTFIIKNCKSNEIYYILATNLSGDKSEAKIKLTTKHDKETIEIDTHTFQFSGNYSSKLYAIKLKNIEFTVSPDTIKDGKINNEYTFKINAENIPPEVVSVYIEYDFDDSQNNNSKGITLPISVDKDRKIETEIKYKWKYPLRKSNIKFKLKNAVNDKELAKAEAFIQFYTVTITGARIINYELKGGATEQTHKFVAEATPSGNYNFEWDFGDGTPVLKIPGKNNKCQTEHRYKNLKPGQKFKPKVKLYDDKNNLLDEDVININIDSKSEPVKPDNKPQQSNNYYIDFRIFVYTNYTDSYQDNNQKWNSSQYESFENNYHTTLGMPINKGNSFSAYFTRGNGFEKISGNFDNKKLNRLNYERVKSIYSGNTKIREESLSLEIRDIPIEEANEYGISFLLWGWDCDKLAPDPRFERSIVKLEQKVKFFPSGKEISIANLDFNKSEVYSCKNWQDLWAPRSHIRVSISYGN
jgi:hypothetical protein